MVRTHPQWTATVELIRAGRVGSLRAAAGFFSYFNRDPANIRNRQETGGGALMDIGCYPVTVSRFVFGEEPRRCLGLVERDPEMGTDRLTSAVLDFPSGQSVFTCGTQLVPYQRMQFFGTRGRIEVEIPFNAPTDRPTRIFIDDGSDVFGSGVEVHGEPDKDGKSVADDVSEYKSVSLQIYATGVPSLRLELISRGQGLPPTNGFPQTTFKVTPGFNTYRVPLKSLLQPEWAQPRISAKDVLKKLTAVAVTAYCNQCTPANGTVVIDNIVFEK